MCSPDTYTGPTPILDPAAIILTDDYNPVDFYDTWLKEELRKNILNSQDADILS